MVQDEIKVEIVKFHVFSFKGIWQIVKTRKYFNGLPFWICIIVGVIGMVINLVFGNHTSDGVLAIASANMAIFPSLTGFSLTAFSVCVNFGNMDFAKNSVKIGKYSMYQKGIAVFAFSISVQVATLAIAYFIKISEKFQKVEVSKMLADIINSTGVMLLLFTACFAFYLIFMIIANIFTFGQLNNSQNTLNKFK